MVGEATKTMSIVTQSKIPNACSSGDFQLLFQLNNYFIKLHTFKLTSFFFHQVIPTSRLAVLPPAFTKDSAYATEYVLAWAVLPIDEEDKLEAYKTLAQDVLNKSLQLNVEFM